MDGRTQAMTHEDFNLSKAMHFIGQIKMVKKLEMLAVELVIGHRVQ